MKRSLPGLLSTITVALAALLPAASARAQGRDEYGDIQQTVARISYFDGQVSFARGDDPDDWQPADRNVPMTLGDRVYTGNRSRIELQVHGGDVIRLGAQSDLAALNLTDDTRQFSMRAGIATFHVRDISDNEVWEVDTPNAAVSFEARGDYRIDVDGNGDTRVFVRRGSANVAAGGGQIPVDQGQGIQIYGIDRPQYDYVRVSGADGWDQWVDQRESRFANAKSYRYISADIVGADDLDEYGRWEQVPQYGWAWTPTTIAVDWAPYRVGHWIWQDPWGWTWVSAEPWGWAPYHYGRWVVVSSRWFWIPVAPAVRYVRYSPALVAFTGGGPGFSVSITAGGGGFVGWFPLGPRDPFNPWWGSRVGHTATVTNVTYVNRTYVTVVNQSAFVSGTAVSSAWVRDRAVVTQVESAPVIRGTIPVMPTAGALRVAINTEARTAPRPPTAIVSRAVVVRAAPPPAPPTFQAKIGVITRNGGAPVEPAAAARISVENRGRPQTVTEVRPVAAEPGRVTLAPKSAEAGETRRPEPVTAAPARGRPIATQQQPVAAQPVTGGEQPSGPPSREVVPRQPAQTQQAQPPQPQPRGNERRRVEPAQPQQEPQVAPQVTPRGIERRRAEPPSAQPQQPQEIQQQQQPRGQERRRVEPAPTPQPQQPQEVQQQPRGQERRRVEPAPQQQVPPPQPPQGYERQRRQEPTPKPDNPQGQQRGRQAPPQQQQQQQPPQQQQQQPPPQQQRQQPPPQQQQGGENREQVQRGRQANPPQGQQNKEKGNEKKDEKKQERGRPTPKPE